VSKHLGDVVKGTTVEIGEDGAELGEYGDVAKIRKVYKLNDAVKGKKGLKGDVSGGVEIDEKEEMEGVILGIMSVKGT
jgi:EKC/KEOPS complex subunit CGI121/TPRKB